MENNESSCLSFCTGLSSTLLGRVYSPRLSGNFVLQVVAYALLRHSLSTAMVMTYWNILHVNKPEEIQHDFNPFSPAMMLSIIALK